jgi:molybdopterin/thiamine biosynthesis adenylyltransferase
MFQRLMDHLFPGDRDEHGAVIAAGMHVLPDGTVRLLARDLHLAQDGVDYVPGKRGYRMLKAQFIHHRIIACRDEKLVYLAIHNHGNGDTVEFSGDDLASHERGYPALLDIARGLPVGALVFASHAIAGDIWLPDGRRVSLESATVVGRNRRILRPAPVRTKLVRDLTYDRQARLFGDAGQELLQTAKVGVIGAGGGGSLIIEYLARLGVGHFVVIDPDRISPSNLPRVVGAKHWDALTFLRKPTMPGWLQALAARWSTPKVKIATRVIRQANPQARVQAIMGDVQEEQNAAALLDCDYLFLAADTMSARLLFNQIVHQYYIPGVQIGSKVSTDKATGEVTTIFSVTRPVTPECGCLWCNQLINPSKLQAEAQSEEQLRAQRYVDEPEVVAPSVITLNAVGAAHAANDFMFYLTGLTSASASTGYMRHMPQRRATWFDEPRRDKDCSECGQGPRSRLGRGDVRGLTTRKAVRK